MIREKYQYSGFTSIIGHAVVSDVPTIRSRFVKKGFHNNKTNNDPMSAVGSSLNPFYPDGDPSLAKERHLEPALYTDPSIAVSQVHVRRDRFFDAERDHIKRFQRGDYDGDFPLSGPRADATRRGVAGGGGGLEGLLSALGEGGMAKRRRSFIFTPKLENEALFDKDGEPIFDVAYTEGLGEQQSRQILRDMERKHRRHQEGMEQYNAARRIREAEEYRRRLREEEEEELRRLKAKLKKSNETLESNQQDVFGDEEFHAQMEKMKKLLGNGKSFGGDTMGDEFMEQGGDQHRGLVEAYNRLFPGGRGTKQKLYNALHYGAVVDDSEMPMKAARDNHFVCPCCGEHHTNGATKAHDPRHVHEAELKALTLQHAKRDKVAAMGPTRSASHMAHITSEQKWIAERTEQMSSDLREECIFKVAKTDDELLREKAELLFVAQEVEERLRERQREEEVKEEEKRRLAAAAAPTGGVVVAVEGSGSSSSDIAGAGAADRAATAASAAAALAANSTPLRGKMRRVGSASTTPVTANLTQHSHSHQGNASSPENPLRNTYSGLPSNQRNNNTIHSSNPPTTTAGSSYVTASMMGRGAIAATSGMSLVKAKASAPTLALAPYSGGDMYATSGNIGPSDPRRPVLTLPPPREEDVIEEGLRLLAATQSVGSGGHSSGSTALVVAGGSPSSSPSSRPHPTSHYYYDEVTNAPLPASKRPIQYYEKYLDNGKLTMVGGDNDDDVDGKKKKNKMIIDVEDLSPAERAEAEDHIDTLLAIAEEEAKGNVPGLRVHNRETAVEYTQARARHRQFERNNPDRPIAIPSLPNNNYPSNTTNSNINNTTAATTAATVQRSTATASSSASASASAAANAAVLPLSTTAQLTMPYNYGANGQQGQPLPNAPRDLKVSIATTSINCKSVPGKPGRGRTIVLNII